MDLVEDHDLAGQRKVTEHQMARLQSGEQHLVDRSDDEVRQLRLLAARQPRMGHDRVLEMVLGGGFDLLVTSDLGQSARTKEALEQAIEPCLSVAQGDRAYWLIGTV